MASITTSPAEPWTSSGSPEISADGTQSAGAAKPQSTAATGWLVHPVYDLLLVANLAWPLLAWIGVQEGFAGREGVLFWQLYFITTPHRWITLLLVFGDRQQFQARKGLFLGVAGAVMAVCLGVRFGTGGLTCLLMIDYLWNAWHFSAQHHGISRLYARRNPRGCSESGWEKWAFRLFLLYVILRVAGVTWAQPAWEENLQRLDWLVPLIPLVLLVKTSQRLTAGQWGGLIYRVSVFGLFLGMLWAAHTRQPHWLIALTTASALFHATEYLAVVGWNLQSKRRRNLSDLGLLGWLIPRWGLTICLFAVILGSGAWLMDQHLLELWLTINVAVAFLHYAYDGIIWRRPAPAR